MLWQRDRPDKQKMIAQHSDSFHQIKDQRKIKSLEKLDQLQ
ncbi:uncharacterized protein METZ01_LOCUS120119 [marine metagenome]|uniref:Uncharacterized protein n=1 Tax=marine metagenome TaxID=408172 RepID=A0A381XRB4_9ZZZZ